MQVNYAKKFSDPELTNRICTIVNLLGSRKAAAQAAWVSEVMICRYLQGGSEPTLSTAVRLARASGVALQWLATGEGQMKGDST